MTKARNLCVFVCVCDCDRDRDCVCDMLMLILGTCWTFFVFMSMLKCCCLWMKTSMVFTAFLTAPLPVSEPIIELVPS